MSWASESFLLLVVALAGGFAWFERSRPSSKLVALVGTLAALAALGRVAFAALPDVKPTTDVVVISGYALGAAPGFAVGAVAALTSNLFFGQGPWTPWQMFAWGLTGVVGAIAARVSPRTIGRWPLAALCALMGFLFGEILNLFTYTTTGGQTLDQFFLIAGRALPFDVAHATGNLLFALAFGPVLLRSLLRFQARLEVTWRPFPSGGAGLGAAIAVLGAASLIAAPGGASPARAAAPGRAGAVASGAGGPASARSASDRFLSLGVAYLRRAQNADGGFGGAPRVGSSQLYTAWASIGLAAAGTNPARVTRSGHSLLAYITAHAGQVHDVGDLERTILALRAGNASTRIGGRDLVSELVGHRSSNGSFGGQSNLTAFAILALRAAGRHQGDATISSAASWLARQQDSDGGFNFATRGRTSGIDDTADVVEALVAAGRGSTTGRAVGFLLSHQGSDGGFPLNPGGPSNAQSTAWAAQALVAARRNPDRVHRRGGRSPLAYLRSLMQADGSVRYSRTSTQTPVWVTSQALAAVARAALPVRPAH